MHTQRLKQVVISCLVSSKHEWEMSALGREVSKRMSFPVHAKEISDAVEQLERAGTVQKMKSSSGSLAVRVLTREQE
ncbi:hypothetical protein [Marinococcus halotolerans]|uniref:hypothetical protein n=1 Tax=Marinococcus halotolerans TaxID=301092 RepID=UPI0003B5158F|nr:hypothetical protein [Marinococcus halotolerans]